MHFRVTLLLLVLNSVGTLLAQELPPEAKKALNDYEKTRRDGIARLNKTLVDRLANLQKQQMQGGDLDAANAIQVEINRLNAETITLLTPQAEEPPLTPPAPLPSESIRAVGEPAARAVTIVAGEAKLQGAVKIHRDRLFAVGNKIHRDRLFAVGNSGPSPKFPTFAPR